MAQLEAAIDFSDEDLALSSPEQLAAAIAALAADVATLHASFERGRLRREGLRAAIVGRPNVGKSSILNLMLGAERAIVTPIPGTTRDVIEESIELGGYAVLLQDTAGMRKPGDPVERIGVERALERAREADLLIAVFDGASPLEDDDFRVIAMAAERPAIALLNKCDLPARIAESELRVRGLRAPAIRFSARDAIGVEALRSAILAQLEDAAADAFDDVAISRVRHREALVRAGDALERARESLAAQMPPEIIAVEIAAAAAALGEITGEIGAEEVLDVIFREFCIGK
jgi:tRNA modification GTPase